MAGLNDLTVFLLIRHGAHSLGGGVLAGRSPLARLTSVGSTQAKQMAQRISHLPIRTIYSSPVVRAQETAEVLSRQMNQPVQISDALSEIDFGQWSGCQVDEVRRQECWQNWNEYRSGTRAPDGELMMEVQSRIVAEMLRLRQQHRGGYVAMVSHGDVIKAGLAYFLGVPIDLFRRIEISLASVTAIALGDRGPWVLCVNNVGEVVLFP